MTLQRRRCHVGLIGNVLEVRRVGRAGKNRLERLVWRDNVTTSAGPQREDAAGGRVAWNKSRLRMDGRRRPYSRCGDYNQNENYTLLHLKETRVRVAIGHSFQQAIAR